MKAAVALFRLEPVLHLTRGERIILAAIWEAGQAGIGLRDLPASSLDVASVHLTRIRAKLIAAELGAATELETRWPDGKVGSRGLGARGRGANGQVYTLPRAGVALLHQLAEQQPWRPPEIWLLNPQEELTTRCLFDAWDRFLADDELRAAFAADGSVATSPNISRTVVCGVREKLKRFSIGIECAPQKGWSFDEASRAALVGHRAEMLQPPAMGMSR